MNQEKMDKLLEEVDIYNYIGDRVDQVARDNKLSQEERDELNDKVWSIC